MCGITGIITSQIITNQDKLLLKELNNEITHRGPDGEGFFFDNQVALGMRRLSIIDINGGWQPLYNENKSHVLFFNGEIYNYVELREDLVRKGHQFRTKSDGEVFIHLYEDHGIEAINFLRGMFAISLYDVMKKRIYLIRDRIGEKPLYYYQNETRLVFASELKPLVKCLDIKKDLDYNALNMYFLYRYIPDPHTPFSQIRKLEAGNFIEIKLNRWEITNKKYWTIQNDNVLTADPQEIFQNELEQISKIIVRSDVPVGIALSSGIDSSGLAALLSKNDKNLTAITIGYDVKWKNDESKYARQIADYLKIPFINKIIKTEDVVAEFPEMVFTRDEPISDIAGLCYYNLMKTANENKIKVLIQGQGGDELFLSYDWVQKAIYFSKLKYKHKVALDYLKFLKIKIPATIISKAAVKDLYGLKSSFRGIKSLLNASEDRLVFYDMEDIFANCIRKYRKQICSVIKDNTKLDSVFNYFSYADKTRPVENLIFESLAKTYLLQNGLAQGDRLSMGFGVELRLPLVDYKLLEIMVSLRNGGYKFRSNPKELFINSVKKQLPDWVFRLPKKGFSPPGAYWLKLIYDNYSFLLKDGLLLSYNIINPNFVNNYLLKKYPGNKNLQDSFMKLIVLEIWLRKITNVI